MKFGPNKIILHSHDCIRLINEVDIVLCKSDSCYTTVYLIDGQRLMISKSLAKFSKQLNSEHFIRVSQSYLVNKYCIKLIHKKKKELELNHHAQFVPFTTTIRELLLLMKI